LRARFSGLAPANNELIILGNAMTIADFAGGLRQQNIQSSGLNIDGKGHGSTGLWDGVT